MRLIQLTDIHIAEENECPYHVDVRTNFLRLLDAVSQESYDALILTGDLCLDTPADHIYEWILNELKHNLPESKLLAISGNHDDTFLLAKHFNQEQHLHGDEMYFHSKKGRDDMFFLDTSKGYASKKQKEWLRQEIHATNQDLVLVFMHHPPCLCQLPHMDNNYALEDREDFMEIFTSFPGKQFKVFSGHYHTDRTIYHKNVAVHLTPSGYVQIDDRYDVFMPEHYRPGFRIIDSSDGVLMTRIKYI